MVGILDNSRVRTSDIPRPSAEIIDGYRQLTDMAGLVARTLDQFGIAGTIPSALLPPIRQGVTVIGPAITVRNIPEREIPYCYWERTERTKLGEREAFFLARRGDIVVIDGAAVYPASCLGSMAVTLAGQLGVAGVVVSGAVTGVAGIRSADIPVWARGGTTITGHHRAETIEINGPIGIEGVRVEPGDLIIADDSGVTVVPRELTEQVLQRALKMKRLGSKFKTLLQEGADREILRKELGDLMVALMRSPKEEGDPQE
jgi:regulator of RNase E activity RraA